MELLSPAGSFSALRAAVQNGADAVYFGGNLFNARLGAQNFDREEMIQALDFCRISGVKSYITMNTLTHDRDILPALRYASFLYEYGTDALIIQDLGLFSLIKKHIPDFELHASTQMCISTLGGVQVCEKLGFRRVVLSRELSLTDISDICRNSSMPIEVFVHGAMCMSFSGGCLFSSMVGKRSGNCGSCAQPCRKYAAIDHIPKKDELNLSLSDLCMIEHIEDLRKAGVMSLKIEGRMKKPEYVASVTHAYRRAIDGADRYEITELKNELFEVFNRGAFSTGYYFGNDGITDRIAQSKPSPATIEKIQSRSVMKTSPVEMRLYAHAGEYAKLIARSNSDKATVIGSYVEEAKNPITIQVVQRTEQQLSKLGGTHYSAENVSIDMTGFLPVSAINELRRRAVSALDEKRILRRETPVLPQSVTLDKCEHNGKTDIIVHVYNMIQAKAATDADEIVLEYGSFTNEEISQLQEFRTHGRLMLSLPITLLKDSYLQMQELVSPADFDGIEINNLGQLEYANRFSHITGGYHLNVFNSHTAKKLLDMGIERLTLSVELNPAQVREIQDVIPVEKLALHTYGRVVLMNLYHYPIREHIGCKSCGSKWHTLYDADGRAFPIIGTKNIHPCPVTRLYNCYAHDLSGLLDKAGAISRSLAFTKEGADDVKSCINSARYGGAPLPDTTRGYFSR